MPPFFPYFFNYCIWYTPIHRPFLLLKSNWFFSFFKDGFNVGYSGGKSYKVVNEPPLNQTNAKLACEADNATLAMSKTDGDALDMMDLIGIF